MDLASALQRRDLAAAQAIVAASALPADDAAQWRAWLLFRAGDAQGALAIYRTLAARGGKPFDLHAAACLFQLRRYGEAQAAAELVGVEWQTKAASLHHAEVASSNPRPQPLPPSLPRPQGPDCALKTRLLAHCASKLAGSNTDDSGAAADLEAALLTGGLDDRLSAAALRYGRCEYEAAGAIYEQLLGQFPDLHALHLYAALCAYMGDDWEASAASLAAYQVGGRGGPGLVQAACRGACML